MTENDKLVLKYHYNAMSQADRVQFRDDFVEQSGIPYPTFYQKLDSDRFRPLERRLLQEMLIKRSPTINRVLIIGPSDTGKSELGKKLAQSKGLQLFNSVPSIREVKAKGIYTSNAITPEEAQAYMGIALIITSPTGIRYEIR